MDSKTFPRLVGEVGGTNARFASIAAPGAALTDVATLPCADHPSLQAAMQHSYVAGLEHPAPRWCVIGIANPVVGDQVRMTHHHWSFSIEQVRQLLGLERVLVINDFTALALSLPALDAANPDVFFCFLGTIAGQPRAVARSAWRHVHRWRHRGAARRHDRPLPVPRTP